jgi:hypothetical protein
MDDVSLLSAALTPRPGDREAVELLLEAADPATPALDAPGTAEVLWLPVSGAEIRVFHAVPQRKAAVRPIVFVPGWGTIPAGWQDFVRAVWGKAELFYLETREKSSSRILDRRSDMGIGGSARDLSDALSALGLGGRDFVLAAACWGATIVLKGMIDGHLSAPTVLVGDPMHTLWFPKWLLRWISPLVPTAALGLLRPILSRLLLGDMREPTQKARAYSFIYGADFWKWKKSAEAVRDFELYGSLGGVREELFVLNGTADKIHDPVDYPRICRELPRGRFLFMPTDESRRERLFGSAALEFARVGGASGLPASLGRFERPVR